MDHWSLMSNLTEAQDLVGPCCVALASVLGDKVSFPGSPTYNSSVSSYFSLQESELQPRCVVSPTTAEDVSTAVGSLSSTVASLDVDSEDQSSCYFAVRSGGHTGFAGAANIANGVTIDLRALNSVEVSEDRTTASVGAGATWDQVYTQLEPLGLAVAGGRAAPVGVAGLTLGGGISYFSTRFGWTCDTAVSFEVVLANGSIVNADAKSSPHGDNPDDEILSDLLVVLRGGSNNFGIVTRIDFEAFEQGPLWGGSVYYDFSTIDKQLTAFAEINSADAYDEYAAIITNFGYAVGGGAAVVNNIEYTKPEANPAVFKSLEDLPSIYSSMRIANLTDIAKEQASLNPNGLRQFSAVTTHASTVPMLNATYLAWNESLATIQDIDGLGWSISLEPLPPAIYARGSNAFGLSDRTESLVVTLLTARWADAKYDVAVEEAGRALMDRIESEAKRLDAYDPFVYLNYAGPWQEPLLSYGKESLEKMQRVKRHVDPKGLFTRYVPGGFKLKG